ncbi:amp-binding enzyme [Apiospora aurea]|uniref:Amp-binding enzyme n=1 Tax=Apiospora aurea TaxID=335848 RepID=A0ABR1QLA3_9PEZI
MGVMSDDGTTKKPVSGDDVYNMVAGSLATYKLLRRGVLFVDAIPRTAGGKTRHFALVQAKAPDDTAKAMGRPSPFALYKAVKIRYIDN